MWIQRQLESLLKQSAETRPVVVVTLPGLSLHEVNSAAIELSIEAFMLRGGFPELYERPQLDPFSFYASYVATYLEHDLRQLHEVGNLRDFERFLRACALRTSQLVNRSELARDVGISESTARQWLSVLEQSGIVTLLEPWFSNTTKSLVKTPKLHFNDSGLAAFLMGITDEAELQRSPLTRALWETTVFAEIRKELGVHRGWHFAFWRDRTKEADFLFHKAGRFKIADAKWSENPISIGKLARIQKELEGAEHPALICRAPHAFPLPNGGEALPLSEVRAYLGE